MASLASKNVITSYSIHYTKLYETGGLVIWIDRMTDWEGRPTIRGVAEELLDRLPRDAIAGPLPGEWGQRDATRAAYWSLRTAAFHGVVTWSPTIDPERLKLP